MLGGIGGDLLADGATALITGAATGDMEGAAK
jgi:hypothetical protein